MLGDDEEEKLLSMERQLMVEDPELPFPESTAAAERVGCAGVVGLQRRRRRRVSLDPGAQDQCSR